MSTTNHTVNLQIADRVARYYTKRVRHADYEDCYQEAMLALLTAAKTFKPERGAWEPYGMRAASRQVRQSLYRAGSPVAGRAGHVQVQLAGTGAVELSAPLLDAWHFAHTLNPTPDTSLEQAQRLARLDEVLDTIGVRMRPASAQATRDVLLGDLSFSEAAEAHGLDDTTVAFAVGRVRKLLKDRFAGYLAEVR